MSENRPKMIGRYRCPECYKKEKDIWLRFDRNDGEYYCVKCCYVASSHQELDVAFENIRKDKYKL